MAQSEHLSDFLNMLTMSRPRESTDIAPILAWREQQRNETAFTAELIPLSEVRNWQSQEGGNIFHDTGMFFSIEGVRISSGEAREVRSWDQPIYNQIEGGILALVARQTDDGIVEFLVQGKAEPGNLGTIQLCPSIQCTWSNIRKAHKGKTPPLAEIITAERGVRIVYSAQHNEEGGRFWRKSNANTIYLVDDESIITTDLASFHWCTLSQIKGLALVDNVLSPFVKTIVAPL